MSKIKPLPDVIVPDTNHYRNIHKRIRIKYGKASKCENPNCSGISKVFDWALKEGRKYSMNIEDYRTLCRSCHMLQDGAKGERQHASKLKEDQVRYIKLNPDNLSEAQLAKKFGVIRQTINLIINNINWKNVKA